MVRLKNANDLFVVDYSVAPLAGEELEADQLIAFARTFVPALDYDGSYSDPVYVISRQVGIDEVIPVPLDLHLLKPAAREWEMTDYNYDDTTPAGTLIAIGRDRVKTGEAEDFGLRMRLTGHERMALMRDQHRHSPS